MQIEDQVVSLELAKKLKELGVNQDSLFWWCSPRENFYWVRYSPLKEFPVVCSAFTVAELGEMLPPFVTTEKYLCQGKPRFNTHEENSIEQHSWHDDRESDARAKMLIHLIKNKLIQFKQEGKS